MASTEGDLYVRLRITGRLICVSELHVGDGGQEAFSPRSATGSAPGNYSSVCRDTDGRPYIPATTLRGHLRALCAPGMAGCLFGTLAPDQGVAGKVRLYDASLMSDRNPGPHLPFWSAQRGTAVRHGVEIDPVTASARAHGLFRYEYVPQGSAFVLRLEANDYPAEALPLLLGLLEGFDGGARSGVGRGRSRQLGRLRWEVDKVDVIRAQEVRRWMDSPKRLCDCYDIIDPLPAAQRPDDMASRSRIEFELRPSSPLLVNEPGLIRQSQNANDHPPKLEHSRLPDGRAMVPAASLRGLIRGRARRILITIAAGHPAAVDHGRVATDLLENLFGSSAQRSRIWISDAVAVRECSPHPQTFVAIDRFTGGGEERKLYKANAADCTALRGEISIDPRVRQLEAWEKGLLLLLARDALEGELAVGWGKARGFGALEVVLEPESPAEIGGWDGERGLACRLRERPAESGDQAQDWILALHDEVGRRCEDLAAPALEKTDSRRG